MNKLTSRFWLSSTFVLYCLATTIPTGAQITSDGTLSTEVNTLDNRNFIINGGSRAGGNLFHSFGDFSVPNGGSAVFNNNPEVQNIISRVTGSSISNIDGLIGANGSANLFLLNPNGIIFDRNASLQIGGSFLATTANRLLFKDSTFFSTTDIQAKPLLTVSIPVGLQFGETVGQIINQSGAENSIDAPVNFQVRPAKTIALVGGGVFLEGGKLLAPGGRIELGSVAGFNIVSLTPISTGWSLGYENIQNFQDIQLSQEAGIDTTGESSGDIQLHGRQIAIIDSHLTAYNEGANLGGTLAVKASESVDVGDSELTTGAFSTGAAADINIETRRLIARHGSIVDARSNADGRGGNITVNSLESVEVDGSEGRSQLSTQAFAGGNAGDVKVKTGRLILRNGGQIVSSTTNAGNGGTVTVDASELVEVSGRREASDGTIYNSALFARTRYPTAIGNGGVLKITTGRLSVQSGGNISVAAVDGSAGQAGSLDINASKSVEVSGIGSILQARSESPKPAGNLMISTNKLIVKNGAEVNVSSVGTGDAGNLDITASSIRLENRGKLTATSASGEGGNIRLQDLNLLLLRSNSEIATDATAGAGNGGNINIDTDLLIGVENSDITATAIAGKGGNIQINTQGIFGIEPRSDRTPESDITASSERGIDGIVEINRPEGDPNADLVILPAEVIDISGLVAQGGCPAADGSDLAAGASQFVVTGRGGLPPNPTEATRSDLILADLGTSIKYEGDDRGDRASKGVSINATNSEPTTLVEATGWVIGSKGEVVLTAAAPSVTADIPWLKPTSCNDS